MNLFIIVHFMMLPIITGVLFPLVTLIGSAFSGYWTVSSNPFAVLIVSACVGCKIIHDVRNKEMDDAMTFYFFHFMLLPIIAVLLFPLVTLIVYTFFGYWTVSSNQHIGLVLIVSACVDYKIIHDVRKREMDDAMTFIFFHFTLLPLIAVLLFPLVTLIGSAFFGYLTARSNSHIVLIVCACVGYKIIHVVRNRERDDAMIIFMLDALNALALSVIATATWLAVTLRYCIKPLNLSENFFDHLKAPSL